MPENRCGCGCGSNNICGLNLDSNCIWIIVIIFVLFSCCGNNSGKCC